MLQLVGQVAREIAGADATRKSVLPSMRGFWYLPLSPVAFPRCECGRVSDVEVVMMTASPKAVTHQARRWTTGIFFTLVMGFLLITACSATGDAAFERVMLTTMIGVFVVGGATLGLLISHQIGGTHLADNVAEDSGSSEKPSEKQSTPTVRRGFLAMFESATESAEGSAGPNGTRPQRRAA